MQKAILFFSIILPISVLLNAQTNQVGNFQNDYLTFLENQKTPFLKANGEVFVLDGTAWEWQLYLQRSNQLNNQLSGNGCNAQELTW